MKEEHYEQAVNVFDYSGVKITKEGQRHPGAALGTQTFVEAFVTEKVLELGSSLHKGAFHDALCPQFGWQPPHMPSNCVCGKQQTVERALSCSHGGFPALRHNDIITARYISEVCHNVTVEPGLQPLTGERLQQRTANSEEGCTAGC